MYIYIFLEMTPGFQDFDSRLANLNTGGRTTELCMGAGIIAFVLHVPQSVSLLIL